MSFSPGPLLRIPSQPQRPRMSPNPKSCPIPGRHRQAQWHRQQPQTRSRPRIHRPPGPRTLHLPNPIAPPSQGLVILSKAKNLLLLSAASVPHLAVWDPWRGFVVRASVGVPPIRETRQHRRCAVIPAQGIALGEQAKRRPRAEGPTYRTLGTKISAKHRPKKQGHSCP